MTKEELDYTGSLLFILERIGLYRFIIKASIYLNLKLLKVYSI